MESGSPNTHTVIELSDSDDDVPETKKQKIGSFETKPGSDVRCAIVLLDSDDDEPTAAADQVAETDVKRNHTSGNPSGGGKTIRKFVTPNQDLLRVLDATVNQYPKGTTFHDPEFTGPLVHQLILHATPELAWDVLEHCSRSTWCMHKVLYHGTRNALVALGTRNFPCPIKDVQLKNPHDVINCIWKFTRERGIEFLTEDQMVTCSEIPNVPCKLLPIVWEMVNKWQ